LIEAEGFDTGEFDVEQQLDDGAVGNLEVSRDFWERYQETGWEGSDGQVQVTMDVP
jgi:hypothetical protein